MAYSDFTLKKVKLDFNIQTVEDQSLFSNSEEIQISDYLAQTLKRNLPLALAINTEKARSELIIINILLEVKEKSSQKISLFSGIDFNVDKEKGLTGFCDYIISGSEEQLYLDLPVITIVEAKNENIISGLGQCIAEMYAAQLFNQEESYDLPCVYGAVTTGDEWRFVKLEKNVAYIDNDSYYISDINKVIGILVNMVKGKA
ncbi:MULTISPECIES: hypothetical protein [unclassified Moorena]|uniref:hypothetical protein n=1 Tax=unclassified Moorena TaxID=2683338 RepID=UPI0013B80DA3|nr:MULTISPECIES: hypothetical protein [unclassified Moorena]NEP36820.1 hypothetical protein [Moorena sp. SIO3B2]NER88657.1 hypothetical protein [Moorena sp. SIO3A2]NES45122.1 hypothetical protein [Moorena sp. SIO2C4]